MELMQFVTRNNNYFNPATSSLLCPRLGRCSGQGEPELKGGPEDVLLVCILPFMPIGTAAILPRPEFPHLFLPPLIFF